MNHPVKDYLRYLLAFVPVLVICLVGVNLFHTEQVSARWIDDVGKDYVVYRKGSTVLYWNSKNSGWSILPAIPQIKLNGSACDTDDDTRDFNSSKTFYNCKGLTISASTQKTWFKEARLAYQIGDFDSRETISVKGGYIAKYGVSTNPPISSDEKSAIAYKGVKFDTNNNGKTDLDCNSPNPNKSNGCSLLLVFDYANGNEFEIDLNNKWNSDGTASSGHEFWYTSPATNEYQTLTFNPNGGSVVDDEVQTDGTVGDENTLWSHRSADDQKVIREYVKGDTANEYPTPTWADHTFLGWYTKASGGRLSCSAPINPNCSRPMNSDLTLYAHWGDTPILKQLTCNALFSDSSLLVNNTATLQLSGMGSITRFSGTISGGSPITSQLYTPSFASGTVSFIPPNNGTYTATFTAYDSNNVASPECEDTIDVGDRPYFEISGGDTIAGVDDAAVSDVMTWNTGAADGYAGGNTNLAVIATGSISGVVTGKNSGMTLPALSFASDQASDYGGRFKALASSVDYSTNVKKTGTLITGNTFSLNGKTGTFTSDHDITVSGNIVANKQVTIIVTGGHSVYLGDITYDNTNNIKAMPRLSVYTQGGDDTGPGNIVVLSGASVVHGNFIAGGIGKFYTCGDASNGGYDYTYLQSHPVAITGCDSQLTVYGTVAASQVILSRTNGSYIDPAGGAAEVFKYGPETWLGAPDDPSSLDNYLSLPPVL